MIASRVCPDLGAKPASERDLWRPWHAAAPGRPQSRRETSRMQLRAKAGGRLVGGATSHRNGTAGPESAPTRRQRPRDPVALLTCASTKEFWRNRFDSDRTAHPGTPAQACKNMKLSIALLAAPALAFAPVAQQRASVKVESRVEKSRRVRSS